MHTFYDQNLVKIDFAIQALEKGSYENCCFEGCQFNQVDLSKIEFSNCRFTDCIFTSPNLSLTAFKEVTFISCKLVGLHFEHCSPFLFEATFENCALQLCSFYKMKLKYCSFSKSTLQEIDFTESDVSGIVFDSCDLTRSVFEQTNLEQTNFKTATNFSINLASNKVKGAKFSADNLKGLLEFYKISIEE